MLSMRGRSVFQLAPSDKIISFATAELLDPKGDTDGKHLAVGFVGALGGHAAARRQAAFMQDRMA